MFVTIEGNHEFVLNLQHKTQVNLGKMLASHERMSEDESLSPRANLAKAQVLQFTMIGEDISGQMQSFGTLERQHTAPLSLVQETNVHISTHAHYTSA